MVGAGFRAAAQHSQMLTPLFTHIPGLKVVCPSTPYDTKGLLIQAIRDNDPVIFCEHKNLYGLEGDVPEGAYTIPFGEANIARDGKDVTIVAYGLMVHRALDAAATLAKEGIEAEVIDLRTLSPLDMDTVLESVENTGRWWWWTRPARAAISRPTFRRRWHSRRSARSSPVSRWCARRIRRCRSRPRSRTCISPAPRMSWKRCARP